MSNKERDKQLQDMINIDTTSLVKLAIFLEGYKLGNGGNIRPLGNIDLDNLWNTIAYLRNDMRYQCKEHTK